MASPLPKATTPLSEGENVSSENSDSAPSKNQRSRLFRSQSITDQLNKTPRVAPNWGHSLSKSYGGNNWPLPTSKATSPGSSPRLAGPVTLGNKMYAVDANEQSWPAPNAPKKRGPKPKNEPATTRRQQLNRIAQRAHRDRKEMYIKNLEFEVKRFRQAYAVSLAERQKLVDENRLLREEIAAFRAMAGLPSEEIAMTHAAFSLPPPQPIQQAPYPMIASPPRPTVQPPVESSPKGISRVLNRLKRKDSRNTVQISPPMQTLNRFENLDISGSSNLTPSNSAQVFPPSPPHGGSQSPDSPTRSNHARALSDVTMSTLQEQGWEQPLAAVALHFIVRLEGVCLDHLHAAHQSDLDPESAPHGHALMGSALNYSSPSSSSNTTPISSSLYDPSTGSPGASTIDQRTLEVLLNLNFETNNGEYISTMGGPIYGSISVLDAWNLVSSHSKFGKFDLDAVADRLASHVTCRGYGPIIEAEEVFKVIEDVSSEQGYGRI